MNVEGERRSEADQAKGSWWPLPASPFAPASFLAPHPPPARLPAKRARARPPAHAGSPRAGLQHVLARSSGPLGGGGGGRPHGRVRRRRDAVQEARDPPPCLAGSGARRRGRERQPSEDDALFFSSVDCRAPAPPPTVAREGGGGCIALARARCRQCPPHARPRLGLFPVAFFTHFAAAARCRGRAAFGKLGCSPSASLAFSATQRCPPCPGPNTSRSIGVARAKIGAKRSGERAAAKSALDYS